MADRPLKGLADFEWASVAQYLVYIEATAKLKPLSEAQIYNFPLARLGPEKLIAQKRRTKHSIEANLSNLASFVGKFSDDMTDEEKVVLRSLYRTIKGSLETVTEHLETAKGLKKLDQLTVLASTEDTEDELPF